MNKLNEELKDTVFLDLETTGLNPEKDRIIEIGLVVPGQDLKLSLLVNPGIAVSEEITYLTGITNDQLRNKPSFDFYAGDLLDLLIGKTIVGHNILKFDIPFLMNEFNRLGLIWNSSSCKFVDTYKIFAYKEKRDLASALKFYTSSKKESVSHRAEEDALDVGNVLLGMMIKYQDDPDFQSESMVSSMAEYSTKDIIDFAGKFVYNKERIPVFNFGNSKGLSVYDNPGLLQWMLEKDFTMDTKRWCIHFLDQIEFESVFE